ncbi:propionyl-CoA synthetase [Skermania sp. ID1734]|uniref:propionyl-CoA synthetase n=1 Tax=Skermania sp. ID1734 TaxID=2597516 RepID=UPI00117E2777|nr:propionyl-CoA synthetase [Skermania sp. ID1734]TSD96646.1 propionyl-CoA synthetase [Skermania sp. ID1734]
MPTYSQTYRASVDDPERFWLGAAAAIDWDSAPRRALDDSNAPFYRWFPDGQLNTCVNAVDRHVAAGRGDQAALIYDSAMTGVQRTYTYAELQERVARFAGVLVAQGVTRGDRVVIYLPMIPEAVVAMLACARIGAIHSVVFGGFAAKELAARITDAAPKLVITTSGGLEPGRTIEYLPIVASALEIAGTQGIAAVIVKNRPQIPGTAQDFAGHDIPWLDWDELTAAAEPADPVPVAATDPLYILYTSGTTGKPKGVVRDNGGHAVALEWSMRHIYDIGPGQVMWTASDVGWVVGHSYIVYGPLLVGATTVLYEGKPVGTPDAGAFWRVINDHGVQALFTAPTALRAIRKVDPESTELDKYDISTLDNLFVAGERLDPNTYDWISSVLHRPVIDHWWQTETGWPVCANPRGIEHLPIKPGSPSVPVPGYRLLVLDDQGVPAPTGEEGNIVLALPLPPGTLTTLWHDDDRYVRSYLSAYDGYYLTGDSGYIDAEGYVYVLGRSDDVINVAGHRLSTGGIEAVLAGHPAVAECAVIGVHDELKGQRPSGYVVLKAGADITPDELRGELVQKVRSEIGAVASLQEVTVVAALPKTRSGKILRKTMRQIVAGEEFSTPSTIEDPAVLETLAETIGRGRE